MELFKFEPLLKQTIWGGSKIVTFKHLQSDLDNVGESWEISGVPGDESVVANGEWKGKTLNEVLAEMKEKLVGADNYQRFGNRFPLLIKFIDARQDLSIQVHPDDETAHKQGKPMGKTEMWYVMDSDEDASLKVGLKKKITPEEYARMVDDDTICDALGNYQVKSGDCFFIPAGRIHAICSGSFIAEIQQTSDVTYRIYDYKRKDKDGNYRQLHTKEAAEAIDYTVLDDYRTDYTPVKNEATPLVSCPLFTTAVYDLTEPMTLDYSELDSFVILIAVKGEGAILTSSGDTYTFREGESVLLPATTDMVKVEGNIKFLETFV
ncbi:MAG: mannose-6-phosphate isomerase [Prevotella sp.]|nr:mannose-6-phosphate isomerase [Prevotella sp.]MDY4555285.1 type I phosphomannose isomerase catalytic subunit [Prevotella sp.]